MGHCSFFLLSIRTFYALISTFILFFLPHTATTLPLRARVGLRARFSIFSLISTATFLFSSLHQ